MTAPLDYRILFGFPTSFNPKLHLYHYHPGLRNIDFERSYYEKLSIEEQCRLNEYAFDQWKTIRDLGDKGAIELAGKIGAFLQTVDPGNDCMKIYKNRKQAGVTGLPLPNKRRKE